MLAKIVSSSVCHPDGIASSIELATLAAKDCIRTAQIDPNDVDYLLNVGIYRDQNMVEPSMAALIQKELGINPDFTRFEVRSTAFSCDVMNGVNGAMNACQIASSVLANQKARYVLVVSSDVHPSGQPQAPTPFKPCGAALLLARSDSNQGFHAFDLNAGSVDDYNGEVGWLDVPGFGANARNLIHIDRDDQYLNRLLQLTVKAGLQFIDKHHIDRNGTALIVPAFTPEFAKSVGEQLGMNDAQIIDTWPDNGYGHTSSFACGFGQAEKLAHRFQRVMYVGAGAGMSAACSLYRL